MTPEQEKRFDELFVDKVQNIDGDLAYEEMKYGELQDVQELKDFISFLLKEERENGTPFDPPTYDLLVEKICKEERARIGKQVRGMRRTYDAYQIAIGKDPLEIEGYNEALDAVLERLTPDTNQTEV